MLPETEQEPEEAFNPELAEERVKVSIRISQSQQDEVKKLKDITGYSLYRLQEIIFEAGLESDKIKEIVEYNKGLTK